MNRIYKTVWNKARGQLVVASEVAHSHSARSGGRGVTFAASMPLGALAAAVLFAGGLLGSDAAVAATFNCSYTDTAPITVICGNGAMASNTSAAVGQNATAQGGQSVAVGANTGATGDQSTAMGNNAMARGNSAIAIGGDDVDKLAGATYTATINGVTQTNTGAGLFTALTGSTAIKSGTYFSPTAGDGSIALGPQARAGGTDTSSDPRSTTTYTPQGVFDIAIGTQAYATGFSSVAIGTGATATGDASFAIGAAASAAHNDSTAFGSGAKAGADSSFAFGHLANAAQTGTIAFGAEAQALNAESMAIGAGAVANGDKAIAIGAGSLATAAHDGTAVDFSTVGGYSGHIAGAIGSAAGVVSFGQDVQYQLDPSKPDGIARDASGNPIITAAGVQRQLQNVAPGRISDISTDAINGSQLNVTNQQVASNTQNVTNIMAGTSGPVVYTDGSGQKVRKASDGNWYLASAFNPDGSLIGTPTAVPAANVVLSATGADGSTTTPTKLTNVAAGTIGAGSTDAINGGQMQAAGDSLSGVLGGNAKYDGATNSYSMSNVGGTGKDNINDAIGAVYTQANSPLTFAGDTGSVGRKLGQTVTIKGGSSSAASATHNLVTQANSDGSVQIDLAQNVDLGAGGSVTTGNSVLDNDGLTITNGGSITKVTSGGTNVTDGTHTTNYGANGFAITGGPSITAGGIDAGSNQIIHVASGGTTTTNAANIGDVQAAAAAAKTHYYSVNDNGTQQGNYTNNGATGVNALAAGTGAAAAADGSIAIGDAASVSNTSTGADATGAVAVGQGAVADRQKSVAIGQDAKATDSARAALALNGGSTAIGYATIADGYDATAVGRQSTATGQNATALGYKASAGVQAVALGANATASGFLATSVGTSATATGSRTVAIGTSASASDTNTVALGNGAVAGKANNVALGAGAQANDAQHTGTLAIGGATAAGLNSGAAVVSIGAAGAERQIQNVAPGVISAGSTDAINGSQLYATNQIVGGLNNFAVKYDKNADGTPNYGSVTFNLANAGSATKNADGTITTTGGAALHNVASAGDITNSANALNGVNAGDLNNAVVGVSSAGLTFQGDGGAAGQVHRNLGQTLAINGGATGALTAGNIGVTKNATGDGYDIQLAQDLAGLNSITTGSGANQTVLGGANGGVTIGAAGPSQVTLTNAGLNNGGNKITNIAAGTAATDAVNVSQLGSVTETSAKNLPVVYTDALGNKLAKANDDNWYPAASVNPDGSVIGTPTAVPATSVLASMQNPDGTATNPTKLANVAPGTLSATSADAINGSQLYGANQSIVSALGGGSALNADGTIKGPTYTLPNATGGTTAYTNVGDALTGVASAGMNFAGDSGANVHRNLGQTLNVQGGATGALTSNNIAVTSNGTDTLNVQLAQNLTGLNSITTGSGANQTVLGGTNGGVTIGSGANQVALTSAGLNNGGNKITNVAAGTAPTDAVNVSQLGSVAANNAQNLPVVYTDATGVTKVTKASDNLWYPSAEVNPDGSTKAGATPIANQGGVIASMQNPNGTTTTATTLSNVGPGTLSATSTQAVNGSQLYGTNQTVQTLGNSVAAGLGGTSSYNASTGQVTTGLVVGGTTYGSVNDALNGISVTAGAGWNVTTGVAAGTSGVANGSSVANVGPNGAHAIEAGNNIITTQNGTSVAIGVNPDLRGLNSVSIVGGPTLNSAGVNMNNTRITNLAPGTNPGDAVNLRQMPMQYSSAANPTTPNPAVPSNDVTLVGGNAGQPVALHNVAAGTASTDAANVSQVMGAAQQVQSNAKDYTDQRMNGVYSALSDVGKRADAGVAGAIATASLPQPYRPGQSMVGAALGGYHGQAGLAVGVSTISDNGSWVFKANVSGNTSGNVGVGLGAGFVW